MRLAVRRSSRALKSILLTVPTPPMRRVKGGPSILGFSFSVWDSVSIDAHPLGGSCEVLRDHSVTASYPWARSGPHQLPSSHKRW